MFYDTPARLKLQVVYTVQYKIPYSSKFPWSKIFVIFVNISSITKIFFTKIRFYKYFHMCSCMVMALYKYFKPKPSTVLLYRISNDDRTAYMCEVRTRLWANQLAQSRMARPNCASEMHATTIGMQLTDDHENWEDSRKFYHENLLSK